jgi:hypothetical protein
LRHLRFVELDDKCAVLAANVLGRSPENAGQLAFLMIERFDLEA